MKSIYRKLMALAVLATAGLTVDNVAIAAEQEEDAIVEAQDAEQDEGAEIQSTVRARCSSVNKCNTPSVLFPGGTISIDADVNGGGTGIWTLSRGGRPVCTATFPAIDPPRSWICNVPRGTYVLTVSAGQSGAGVQGAIRW